MSQCPVPAVPEPLPMLVIDPGFTITAEQVAEFKRLAFPSVALPGEAACGYCNRKAGCGTDHPGTGECRLHDWPVA